MPQPMRVKQLITDEYVRASRMRSLAQDAPDADAGLRYLVRVRSFGGHAELSVFVTERNRTLARVSVRVAHERLHLRDGTAELQHVGTDWQSEAVTLILGDEPCVLRPPPGAK